MRAGEMPDAGTATQRPRVLLLIKGLGLGGAERLLVDVVATRDRARFDYEVAYVLAGQDALVGAMEATGVRVHCLGATASADLRWTAALRQLLVVRGPVDVLHAHLPYAAAFGRLVALSLAPRRRPVLVYTEHSLWNKAAVVTKALNRATVGLDQALFVVTPAARDALPAPLRRRARVVVHGVDRTRFAALDQRDSVRRDVRAELGVADGELLALTVANLRSEKGYDVLLETARLAAAGGARVRFVSVGRGPLEGQLAAAVVAGGLGERVQLLGMRTDTTRLMTGADVFVLPSHQEGLSVALMEAMSAGLPVVATAVGGVPDVVTDGVEGFLVPPGRPDLLLTAIARLEHDTALRTRLAGAALARSVLFDVRNAVREIESVYTELLEKRR